MQSRVYESDFTNFVVDLRVTKQKQKNPNQKLRNEKAKTD